MIPCEQILHLHYLPSPTFAHPEDIALLLGFNMFHTVPCLKHPKTAWNWDKLPCRQITKEPKAELAGDAQRSVDARAGLHEAGASEGATLSSNHANELKGSAASQSQSHPGLHVAKHYPHTGDNKSRLASKPGLQSRAAQQVMQQRQGRLQQAAIDCPNVYTHQTSAM